VKNTLYQLKAEAETIILEITKTPCVTTYHWNESPYTPAAIAGAPSQSLSLQPGVFTQKLQLLTKSTPKKSLSLVPLLSDAKDFRILELNKSVGIRQHRRLWPQDQVRLFNLGAALCSYIAAGGTLDAKARTDAVRNGDNKVVMWRTVIYDEPKSNVAIRLHLFPNASETWVHNHRCNFASMSLYGSYQHSRWELRELESKDAESCYVFERNPAGGAQFKCTRPGSLYVVDRFVHPPGHAYFLERGSFHTVLVPKQSSSEMLSLYVKDKATGGNTEFLLPSDKAIEEFRKEIDGVEQPLTDEESSLVQAKMMEYIRQAAKTIF